MTDPVRTSERPLRSCTTLCAAVMVIVCLSGCGTVVTPFLPQTSVTPLSGEDLSGPCKYELRLVQGPSPTAGAPPAFVAQKGVLVVFERGDDLNVFDDPGVIAMAAQLDLAMMFAEQCDAASYGDVQEDASAGPGRALFTALSQFAVSTSHPELANANLVLFGFSITGYLGMTMANAYPGRVLGAVLYAPATAYADMDDLAVASAAARIPMLITANAQDIDAGSQRPEDLFLRGQAQGAPWAFAVQNGTGHCCSDSIEPLLVPWVTGVLEGYTEPAAEGLAELQPPPNPAPATVLFQCVPDGVVDVFYDNVCAFTSESILPLTTGGPTPGWLPDAATANAWVTWVTSPGTN